MIFVYFFILLIFIIIFTWNWKDKLFLLNDKKPIQKYYISSTSSSSSSKFAACFYAYYEKNNEYKENLAYFLENGGLYCKNIDFYIIINGECSVDLSIIEKKSNVVIIKRPNTGYDFGAWQHCINKYILPNSKSYDYYFFMNSSVRGPFPAEYGTIGNRCPPKWVDLFVELFISPFGTSTDVNLAGVSINMLMTKPLKYAISRKPPYTHVQSQFFVLSKKGFNYLLDCGFFNDDDILNNPNTKIEYMVINKEIKMTSIILDNGWNINAYLSEYRNRDYRTITENINPTGENPWNTCSNRSNNYFGRDITPEDAIFFKVNVSCIDQMTAI